MHKFDLGSRFTSLDWACHARWTLCFEWLIGGYATQLRFSTLGFLILVSRA